MYTSILIALSIFFLSFTICQINPDAREVFDEFEKFLKQFNKSYTNMEIFNSKYAIFKSNFFYQESLANMQRAYTNESESCFGISPFMDISPEEFRLSYTNLNATTTPENFTNYFNSSDLLNSLEDDDAKRFLQTSQLPTSWDWRIQGATNQVQNQGYCGGCWAFSAIANIEGVYFKKYGILPKFSEQQLIDCDPTNSGCTGGIMHNTYSYIQAYGLSLESQYPYQFAQGYCRYNSFYGSSIVAGYQFAGSTNERHIARMLYQVGPLAVTINARNLQYYTGGVINIPYESCPYSPTHGVNIVGFGTTIYGLDYWIVRNTWGSNWGEGGYFRIARGRGLCGINQYVISAIIK